MSLRADALPAWTSLLAVVAHPDDESFGLGALLDAFTRVRAGVEVLCLTHGEASTLHGAPGDLASVRGAELLGDTESLRWLRPPGDDTAPTPTELFIASLASCVSILCPPPPGPKQPAHERAGS